MKTRILVDLERCVGCWTCAMACKTGNDLADDAYRLVVRTLGSGTGIDRPAGVYPELTMGWMPVYSKQCVLCAERLAADKQPYCVYNCPTAALAIGDADDPTSAYSSELARVHDGGYRIFELPSWEDSKPNITYASKK